MHRPFRMKLIGTGCVSSERTRLRLRHIMDEADAIADYLQGMSIDRFRSDRRTVDAVERCLSRITEAVIHIGKDEADSLELHVPWEEVRALGNRLRHEYHRLDRGVIYNTAVDDVPLLRRAAARALDT